MISTVIFYNFIILLSTFFVYWGEKGRTQWDRWALMGAAFLIVFVPSALRYDIGTDFMSYMHIYNNIDMYQDQIEEGYYWLNKLLREIGAAPQWIVVTTSFIFVCAAFKGYPDKNKWIAHLVFFSLVYFPSLNIIRQAIAVAFLLWGLRLYFLGHNWRFLLLIIVASLFHVSALIWLPILLISKIPLSNLLKFFLVPLIMIGTMFLSFVSPFLINLAYYILSAIGSDYSAYFSSNYFVSTDLSTGLGVLAMLLFSVWIIINTKYLVEKDKRNWFLILLIFAFSLSQVLSAQVFIFTRIKAIFLAAPVYAVLALVISSGRMRKLSRMIAVIFIIFSMVAFFKLSFGIQTGIGDPNVNPYQTVFTREAISLY